MVDVSRFHQVAATNQSSLKIDTANQQIVAPQTTFSGKVAKFFGTESQATKVQRLNDNINIRNEFVQALENKYGANDPAVMAAKNKILADVGKSLSSREINKVLTEVHKTTTATVALTNPANNQVANIPLKSLPASLVNSTPNLQAILQTKVDNGRDMIRDLVAQNGNQPNPPAQPAQVSDIMWFLQVAAEGRNGQTFKEGAVTIPDPGGHIRDFLDSYQEVYQRKSSHLNETGGFQDSGAAHRGIDMHSGQGLATQLPNSRNHSLYGFLPANAPNLSMPNDRLFVKLEGHGARLWGDPKFGHDNTGPANRNLQKHDLADGLSHGASFLSGIKDKVFKKPVNPDARKERIPNDVKDQFKALAKAFEGHPQQGTLNQDNPTGISRGVRVMAQNLTAVSGNLANMIANNQGDPVANQMLKQGVDGMLNSLTQRYGGGAQITERIGNEVILENGDF